MITLSPKRGFIRVFVFRLLTLGVLCFGIVAVGCASSEYYDPYVESESGTGYRTVELGPKRYRVEATTRQGYLTIYSEKITLLRSATLAKEKGFNDFAVVDFQSSKPIDGDGVEMEEGHMLETTFYVIVLVEPGERVEPEDQLVSYYNADQIISTLKHPSLVDIK